MEKVIIFGVGDISDIAHFYLSQDTQYEVVAFTMDKEYIKEEIFRDLPVVAFDNLEDLYSIDEYKLFIPLGYTKGNKLREQKFLDAKEKGYKLISYISPNATIASNAKIGENCFIFENNTIQPFTTIEDNCILWSGNHIGHHSTIKAHCFIASHVVISGGVEVGENTFIGVNATLRDHISIGVCNVIGAGAIIMSNTDDGAVYAPERTSPRKIKSSALKKI